MLARIRKEAPIAFVPQLGSTLLCSRDDIFVSEKQIDVFSSHQPQGLMNKLMGHNMMRKDGDAHMTERKAIFPTISPKTVKTHWNAQFQAHADRIIDSLEPSASVDFVQAFALPFSAECLKSITGLTNMRFQDMNAWSQGDDRRHCQLYRRSRGRGALRRRDLGHRCRDRRHGAGAVEEAGP